MIDKIIQIADSINNDGDGNTYGLGESGTLYQLNCIYVDNPDPKKRKVFSHYQWTKIIDSPEVDN
jgi:hypothetical protein